MRADFSLDYDVLTVERPQKLYLMARLVSGPAPDDTRRRPINLGLVIDRSGSMAGDKIDYTRQAAQFLVQNLGPRDLLSIVLYNDKVETLLTPEPVDNKDAINQLIEQIKVRGTTNLSGGWLEGCKHVADYRSDEMLNRVILMTDGLANRGVTEPSKLISLARQKREEGIYTTTMGLGNDFNEDLLIAMADAGGGAFYFIESPESAPTIFEEELQGLLNLVGQNLTISIETTPHVTVVNQLNAYPMHSDGRRITYQLGDVFGEELKTLLLELSIPSLKEMGTIRIATLRFEYDELRDHGTSHQVWELPVMVNVDKEVPKQIPDSNVTQAVYLLKAAQARQRAIQAADKGEYENAAQILREVAKVISEVNLTANDEKLREEEQALLRQAEDLERGAERYNSYNRKTMVTQAIYTMTSRHDETVVLRSREIQKQAITAPPVKPEPLQPIIEEPPVRQPGVSPTVFIWNNQTFPIDRDLIRLGRSDHNEVVISGRGISRFHCQIRREGNAVIIEDLGSTNGTSYNGKMLDAPLQLSVGDVVYLCDEKLIFK